MSELKLNCVSHAGTFVCDGDCKLIHIKFGGTIRKIVEYVDCEHFKDVV